MASASAQIGYDTVIANLRNDGFTVMRVSKTFLGRIRITSRSSQYMREIVLSRTTGEIMRDVLMPMDAGSSAVSGGSGGSGGGAEETASGTVGKVKETVSSTTSTVTSTTKKATSKVKKEVEKVTGGLGLGG